MRASEWQFLCAVHEQPKSCCAIDYCCHTLDWAANVVTDQKIFASRLVALSDTHNKNMAMKNLVNVFRRLHRIFAHAWFQHRSVFWSVEGQTGLYIFFKRVCDMYDLIPGETYKLPPEAEGLEPEVAPVAEPAAEKKADVSDPPFPAIVRTQSSEMVPEPIAVEEDPGVGRTNTRRHIRSNPSTGSAVTTVIEADEDEGAELLQKTKELSISGPPRPLEEEPEAEEVPVIVEDSMMHQSAETTASPTDVETPVQATTTGDVGARSGDEPAGTSSGAASEPATSMETQTESRPPASEAEAVDTKEANPEPEKSVEESSAQDEKAGGETRPASQEEGPTGDSAAAESEASSAAEKPSESEFTEGGDASSGAADAAADEKPEEEPKKD